jgi:hypothetical protein
MRLFFLYDASGLIQRQAHVASFLSLFTLLYKACRFFSNLISSPSGVAGFFIR